MRDLADHGWMSPGHFCTLPAPTAVDLREFAERLRALAKDIFQGGQDNFFASAEAGRLRHPLVTDWYFRACCFEDEEQQRFFYKAWMLLGDVASEAADSPYERLESLAIDVDELAATIDPQHATASVVKVEADDSAFVAAKTPPESQVTETEEMVFGWADILTAAKRPVSTSEQRRIRRMNQLFKGPIITDGHPRAVKVKLLEWLKWLQERKVEIDGVNDDEQAREREAVETANVQTPFGRNGIVAHEIGGSVTPRKGRTSTNQT